MVQVQAPGEWKTAGITDTPLIVTGPSGAEMHDGGRHPERPGRIAAVMAGRSRVFKRLSSSSRV